MPTVGHAEFPAEWPKRESKYKAGVFYVHTGDLTEMQLDQWNRLRNTCGICNKRDKNELRKYDMMWGEAELWCGRCNNHIRELDYG